MGTVLRGGLLTELEPPSVEVADLRVAGGRITARGTVEAQPGDEVIDATGRVVLPGLVSAHHHLSATLLRGLRRGRTFGELQALRDHLAAALTLDDLRAGCAAGALEGLLAGTTTVLNVFGCAAGFSGALARIADAVSAVGLRAVLACEVTGREGAAGADAALEEVAGFAGRAKGRLRAAVALGELDAVSDQALTAVRAFHESRELPLLVSLAEDRNEEKRGVERFGKAPIDRLLDEGLVGERSVLAQGVHLSWPDLSRLLGTGAWLVHTARSNMASQAGLATAAKFGVRACLGTDAMPLDMLAEAQAATMRATDSGQPIDALRFLTNGHRLASQLFGAPFGVLREGAVADLVLFDYHSPTPLTDETLAGHLLQGLSARDVESVMVDGIWRLWKRRALALDVAEVARASREAAQAVWARMPS